jgi:hypothetical protein
VRTLFWWWPLGIVTISSLGYPALLLHVQAVVTSLLTSSLATCVALRSLEPIRPALLVFSAVCFLIFFSSTLFYTITLLFIVFMSLLFLTSSGSLSVLASLILVIVYAGAMMILIGYICAVSPNFITSSRNTGLFAPVLLAVLSLSLLARQESFTTSPEVLCSPVDYFYSSCGLPLFLLIALLLFLTLLIVTSQYSRPKGPLRSV